MSAAPSASATPHTEPHNSLIRSADLQRRIPEIAGYL
jgi:hypothetical protein